MSTLRSLSDSVDVCLFELSSLPFTSAEHLSGELGLKLGTSGLIVGALSHLVGLE